MAKENLIDFYSDLHASKEYGHTSVKTLRFIRPDIKILKPRSIIDFGCGQSRLLDELELDYPADLVRYDPAIPAFSQKPEGVFDLLINVDVLEHIREPDLDPIIEEMRSFCRDAILIVDTVPAKLHLPSGENAHVTIRPREWWAERLGRQFPHLVPIRTSKNRRAAFRTFDHSPEEEARFRKMRRAEDLRYLGERARYLGRVLTGRRRKKRA